MRLYIQMIYPIFILLVWLKYWAKMGFDEVHAVVFNDTNIQTKLPKKIYTALRHISNVNSKISSYTIESLLETLQERINAQGTEEDNHEGDIIDLIIKTFNIPFGYNVINGKGIEKLKRALISPNELNILNEHVKNQEKSCISCGRELKKGSMCTIQDSEGSLRIFCTICKPPEIVPCKNCGEYMSFTAQFSTKKSVNCELHRNPQEKPLPPDKVNEDFIVRALNRVDGPPPPQQYRAIFRGMPIVERNDNNRDLFIEYAGQRVGVNPLNIREVDLDPPLPEAEDLL